MHPMNSINPTNPRNPTNHIEFGEGALKEDEDGAGLGFGL